MSGPWLLRRREIARYTADRHSESSWETSLSMARTEVKRDRIRGWVAESPKEGELQSDDRANQTRLQKQNSERCLGNIMRLAERSRSSQPRERSSLSSHGDYNSFETSTRRTDVGAVALLQEIFTYRSVYGQSPSPVSVGLITRRDSRRSALAGARLRVDPDAADCDSTTMGLLYEVQVALTTQFNALRRNRKSQMCQ